MAYTYQDMGYAFQERFSIFFEMTGWIADILFMLFFACIAV